jgi:hypothetical protein
MHSARLSYQYTEEMIAVGAMEAVRRRKGASDAHSSGAAECADDLETQHVRLSPASVINMQSNHHVSVAVNR